MGIDKDKSKELLNRAYPRIIELINKPNISDIERIYAKFVVELIIILDLVIQKKIILKLSKLLKNVLTMIIL